MRVMLAADYSAPQSGNFISSLIALGRAIKARGDEIVFVFPYDRSWVKWMIDLGFQVVITGEEGLKADLQTDTLVQLSEEYRIDLLHLHFGMFHYAIAHNRSAFKNVKIIIHDHMDFNLGAGISKQFAMCAIKSLIYRKNKISIISVMERKTKSYIFLKDKWYVPNGLSFERNIDRSMSRLETRTLLKLSEKDRIVLLLGWDFKRKGFDIALKAVEKCRKIDPYICLGVIGAGQGRPSESAKLFIKNETDIDPNEPWIHYFNNYEDMFAIHRAVDAYISTSRFEAFSYGLLEAISQNTPVVVSNIPGTRWAKEYNNSYFYPTEDVESCACSIIEALRCGRKQTNSEKVIQQYSIEIWCNSILEIYKTVLSNN